MGLPDIDGSLFDGDAFKVVRPIAVVKNWNQGGNGVDDGVSKLLGPLVAVARCAAAGVGFSSGRDDQGVAFKLATLCFNLKLVANFLYF